MSKFKVGDKVRGTMRLSNYGVGTVTRIDPVPHDCVPVRVKWECGVLTLNESNYSYCGFDELELAWECETKLGQLL